MLTAQADDGAIYVGSCGQGTSTVGYRFYADGLLAITGTGEMSDIMEGNWSFNLRNVPRIEVREGVTHIGNAAFRNFQFVESLTLPSSLISIGENAFENCFKMTGFSIPEDAALEWIGFRAFCNCIALKRANLPDSVFSIGNVAFSGCTALENVTLPSNLKSVSAYAFSMCTSLKSITIPETVTDLGRESFSGCAALTEINIPDSITSIGKDCFKDCADLTVYTSGENTVITDYCKENGIPYVVTGSIRSL